jgi:hypothetical protein
MLFALSQESLISQFLMLSYFSRFCISCLAGTVIWSISSLVRFVIITRARSKIFVTDSGVASLLLMRHKFDGIFYLSELLSLACLADLMFSFIHTYLARATDANPFLVLIEAWGICQLLFVALLLIHSLRWYISSVLLRKYELLQFHAARATEA